MLLLLLSSVLGVLASRSALVHLASAVSMGLLWIQSGWIGHNSGHYTVMSSSSLNRLAQIVSGNCLTGISFGWWKRNHNAHHIACNSVEFDPDMPVSPSFFSSLTSCYYVRTMSFDPLSRFLVSIQHWTFYPLMYLARLNLFAQSLSMLLSRRSPVPRRRQEILGIAMFWTWYPLLVSCLPTWRERAAFVLVSFSVTGVQHVQFCLSHVSSTAYVGPPRGNGWFEKQTEGTLNIACPPWMDWLHGGAPVPGRAPPFPEAADVPPEDRRSPGERALQEARAAVRDRRLPRGQQEDGQGPQERCAPGPRPEQPRAEEPCLGSCQRTVDLNRPS
ncbi:delta(8)-fatty-acid desaturase 2-like [Iris pallida]|uniref:Delta(8)-fatty-acid desaturase 2-like n=1 Tax=Iris pallida TaxID=29817 RepID=A0AAX6IG53_IRIPA|nr:delta(8)-fatty-acid desaturase 2-like [Iris pallida]